MEPPRAGRPVGGRALYWHRGPGQQRPHTPQQEQPRQLNAKGIQRPGAAPPNAEEELSPPMKGQRHAHNVQKEI